MSVDLKSLVGAATGRSRPIQTLHYLNVHLRTSQLQSVAITYSSNHRRASWQDPPVSLVGPTLTQVHHGALQGVYQVSFADGRQHTAFVLRLGPSATAPAKPEVQIQAAQRLFHGQQPRALAMPHSKPRHPAHTITFSDTSHNPTDRP